MVKVMSLQDMDRFLEFIDGCNGAVFLQLPEVGICDLKRDAVVRQMLRMMGKEGLCGVLELSFTDRRDIPLVLDYLMNAAKTSNSPHWHRRQQKWRNRAAG